MLIFLISFEYFSIVSGGKSFGVRVCVFFCMTMTVYDKYKEMLHGRESILISLGMVEKLFTKGFFFCSWRVITFQY